MGNRWAYPESAEEKYKVELEKRILKSGDFGIFARKKIFKGEQIFSSKEWIEDEVRGWELLTIDAINRLTREKREKFLKYSYDKDFGLTIGTFNWDYAKHLSNFMNHSCKPNMVYDTMDNIIALKDIDAGEELTIDYGIFIVNFDQTFTCNCNDPFCRIRILKNDWLHLLKNSEFNFPMFMQREVEKYRSMGHEIQNS